MIGVNLAALGYNVSGQPQFYGQKQVREAPSVEEQHAEEFGCIVTTGVEFQIT